MDNKEDNYINEIKVKNPTLFQNNKVQITSKSLEWELRKSFRAGVKAKEEDKSIFETIFGKSLFSK